MKGLIKEKNELIVEHPIDSTVVVDIACAASKIAIGIDGPSHFDQNDYPLGHTILKRRLIKKLGWNVVSIPYYEWGHLQTNEQKIAYLNKFKALEKIFKG